MDGKNHIGMNTSQYHFTVVKSSDFILRNGYMRKVRDNPHKKERGSHNSQSYAR